MQDLKNKFIDFAKRESTFLCLAVGWLFFAVILPIIFINNKYHLFIKADDFQGFVDDLFRVFF